MRQLVRLTGVLLTTLALAACGGSQKAEDTQKQAEDVAKSAEQTGKGLESMAKGLEQMAKTAEEAAKNLENQPAVEPVSFRELQEVLPTVSGWEMEKPRGEKMTSPVSFSKSEVTYRKNDAEVRVEVVDSGFNQLLIAPAMMMLAAGYERETESGYEKGTKVGEFPAFEKWNSESKDGELNVVVAKRFIVKVDGNNLDDPKVLHEFARAANLSKLAGMK